MLDERFIILGFFINMLGSMSYLVDTVKGKTKPNRVTWILWAAAPMLAFSAQIKQNVGLPALMTFSAGFFPLLILISTFFNKKSEWKIGKLDIACGALSVLGLILWQITQVGNLAIAFAIIADGLAAVPTVVKSYTNPETENYLGFLFAGINAIIALLVIKNWDFTHYAFPVYILLICTLLFVLIKFKLGRKILKMKVKPN